MKLLADWQQEGPLLMLWPYRDDVWRGNARPVQQQLLNLLNLIGQHHPVRLGVHPPQFRSAMTKIPTAVSSFPIAYDDIWVRDIAPLFLQQAGQITCVAGEFNGWQGVNAEHRRDRQFAGRLAARTGLRMRALPLVFEAGMLSHDGAGTAVVHARSLQARNPDRRRSELQRLLIANFGFKRIIWLEHALAADETGGHTDNQLQFVAEDTIVFVASTTDTAWNLELDELQRADWAQAYRWIELPPAQMLPEAISHYADIRQRKGVLKRGHRPLLLSYANVIRLPSALVVPQFGIAEDASAVETLSNAFPQLSIIAADALEFVRGGGGPHCLSVTLPA